MGAVGEERKKKKKTWPSIFVTAAAAFFKVSSPPAGTARDGEGSRVKRETADRERASLTAPRS